MKKTMKTAGSVLMGSVLAVTAAAFAGCGTKVPDTEDFLEVYCVDLGYGTAWVNAVAEEFFKQDWVQEKYPGATKEKNYYLQTSDQQSYGSTRLGNEATNSFDLMFDMYLQQQLVPGGAVLDLTELVYNEQVPGENVTFKKKMKDDYVTMNRYLDIENPDNEQYFSISWADGIDTIYYNKALLDAFLAGHSELSVGASGAPNTTDELLAICEAYRDDWDAAHTDQYGWEKGGFAFAQSKDDDYLAKPFNAWWAQYEGVDEFYNFWNGIPFGGTTQDLSVFRTHTGVSETLSFMEDILQYHSTNGERTGGYIHTNYVGSKGFQETQAFFLSGTSPENGGVLFHANGDWLPREMENTLARLGDAAGNFRMMRLPVLSTLGTEYGITDELLSAMVDYVDNTANTVPEALISAQFPNGGENDKGYTYEDVLAAVAEARGVVHTLGGVHNGIIPANATAKDMAVDFILFMATDIAQAAYAEATDGSFLPFEYNVKEKNPELYDSFSQMQKDKIDYFYPEEGTALYTISTLPMQQQFALNYYGQVEAVRLNTDWYKDLLASSPKMTAAQYIEDTVNYWTQDKFDNALKLAGLA